MLANWGSGERNQVAYSADGSQIAMATTTGIYLYNAQTLEAEQVIPTGASVMSIAYSPDGKTLAYGLSDLRLYLWDINKNEALHELKGTLDVIIRLGFSPDGKTLASVSGESILLWDADSGELLHSLDGHMGWVQCITFSPDGIYLAAAARYSLLLWRVKEGTFVKQYRWHDSAIRSVAISPDGKAMASGSDDKTIAIWRFPDGLPLYKLEGHTGPVRDLGFSPDGKTLVSGSSDGTVRFWRLGKLTPQGHGTLLQTVKTEFGGVRNMIYSPDKKNLAALSLSSLDIWKAQDGSPDRQLDGHEARVRSAAFSPDGSILATGSDDMTVRLWRTKGQAPEEEAVTKGK